MVIRSKTEKKYFGDLKYDIAEGTKKLKHRFDIFPWVKLNKACRSKLLFDSVVVVNGKKFTSKELKKEISIRKNSIKSKNRPSYYNNILRSFTRDCRNIDERNVLKVYNKYTKEVNKEINSGLDDLQFCLDALKSLNTQFKNIKKYAESVDILLESVDETMFTEGANTDLVKILKGCVVKQKQLTNKFTSAVKSNDFKTAHLTIGELKKNIQDSKKAIKAMPESTITEDVIGFLNYLCINFAKGIPVLFIPVVGPKLAVSVAAISLANNELKARSSLRKFNGNNHQENDYNANPFRDYILTKIDDCDKAIDKLRVKLNEKEKSYGKEPDKNE